MTTISVRFYYPLRLAMAVNLAPGAIAGAAGYLHKVQQDRPVAWWRFQDPTCADGAVAKDTMGSHDGTFRGGIKLDVGPAGIGGKAARFDGRTAYVDIPHHKHLALNELSVECWFRSRQPWTEPQWPASATLISSATDGAGSGDWVLLGGSADGRNGVIMARPGPKGSPDCPLASPPALNDDQWHHLVWTRTGGGENCLYVDGTRTSSGRDSGGPVVSDRPLQIGGDPFLQGKFFDGWLAEVAVYPTVLDEKRIVAHLTASGREPRKWATRSKPVASAPPMPSLGGTRAGWIKSSANPVLGGSLGTCFDISVLRVGDTYRMYFSWRPKKSVALVESQDGATWSEPRVVLGPEQSTGWEDDINRPVVVQRNDGFHMWYTGQARGKSWIGYATSADGKSWKRASEKPVLSAEAPWEKVAVMCPHVIWDAGAKLYRMWYSGGEQYEPDAIGYATSPDGLVWAKHAANPVFAADPKSPWEQHKVTACQVVQRGGWYLMFYIGFFDENRAQIGIARSRNGISGWERHPANPIISPDPDQWDGDACYKPYAIYDGKKWLLWYNGRRGGVEQIGLATHEGEDLGFAHSPSARFSPSTAPAVLKADDFRHYVDAFNRNDQELYPQFVPNAAAWRFLKDNVPLLDCPDKGIELTYYFRWWTYRKHIKQTPDGFVITEFLPPVGWAGKYNTINCAAGHHIREGRWLHEPRYLDDYSTFWLRKGGAVRSYSCWIADSILERAAVTGDTRLALELLPDLIANYQGWEKDHLDPSGLFWQVDDRDGMEVSISGALDPQHQGFRATINSYQYGDALAIARLAEVAGQDGVAREYRTKAARLKQLVLSKLWDRDAQFFKVLPRGEEALSDARELHGFTPWYFDLPDAGQSIAWKQLMDPQGFHAPFGPTTAEQRHPMFAISYQGHECQWNGPSWPFATSITLTALANLLNNYQQDVVTRRDFFDLLRIYSNSQRLKRDDGTVVPWIDENLNPLTGDWISRTRLKSWKNGTWDAGKGGEERGKDYNHSTFCDLVITGLIGLRPRLDQTVEVNPLVPEGRWDWFCLDQVAYHGHTLTILYDRTGTRYGHGRGLRVLADGKEIAASEELGRVSGRLPQSGSSE